MTTAITIVCSVIAIDGLILLFTYASNRWKYDGNDDYWDEE